MVLDLSRASLTGVTAAMRSQKVDATRAVGAAKQTRASSTVWTARGSAGQFQRWTTAGRFDVKEARDWPGVGASSIQSNPCHVCVYASLKSISTWNSKMLNDA